MMKSEIAWPEILLAVSVLCALVVGGTIIWLDSLQPSGVVALLASIPFVLLARYAWSRRGDRQRSGQMGPSSGPPDSPA